MTDGLTIGELAKRAGVATSALRFYEAEGLLRSERTSGNQRRYHPAELRRVSVIKAAQAVGLTLDEVRRALEKIGERRVPTTADWTRMSETWRADLDARIESLQRLREDLDGCIGCGCLSLKSCALFNPDDTAGRRGAGPRYLMGDPKPSV